MNCPDCGRPYNEPSQCGGLHVKLTKDQVNAAKLLRTIRPDVIPGTNAIADSMKRTAFYAIVVRVMEGAGITGSPQTNAFCDLAGVPN